MDDAEEPGGAERASGVTVVSPPRAGAPKAAVVEREHDGDGEQPDQSAPPRQPVARAAIAGAVAAAMALAVGELVSAFGSASQSLVGGVGTEFIERAGGDLIRLAISSLGTNDKPALIIGIVVISLAIGAFLGVASLKRAWVAPLGFTLFGLVGMVTGLRDPQNNGAVVVLAALLAAAAGVVTLRWLLHIAITGRALPTTSRETPVNPHASRREFFTWAGGVGAFAGAAAYGAHQLAGRSAAEAARTKVTLPSVNDRVTPPPQSGNTLDGLSAYITPNDKFYRIDTALVTPQIEPANWSLQITGLVDKPITYSFDQLLALPMVEETVTLSCVSNEVGGELVGNAVWQGVPLKYLLDKAGVQPAAGQIVGVSADGWTGGFPRSLVDGDRPVLVAVGMNGEPLPIPHGFPARLVVAGLYGYVSATKWLTEIRLTTWEGFDGYWMDKGWSKEGPIKTQSRIDLPKSLATIAPGKAKIAGVAWAPTRGISKVEVQVDGGAWTEAKLYDVNSDNTWRQWVVDWDATPGEHVIKARATDGQGEVQTDKITSPEPNGATGYPTRRVRVQA